MHAWGVEGQKRRRRGPKGTTYLTYLTSQESSTYLVERVIKVVVARSSEWYPRERTVDDEWVLLPGLRLLFLHREDFCDSRSHLVVVFLLVTLFTWLCRVARARSLSISSLCLVALSQGQVVLHLIDPGIATLSSRIRGRTPSRGSSASIFSKLAAAPGSIFLHLNIRSSPSLCACLGWFVEGKEGRERDRRSKPKPTYLPTLP